MSFRTAASTTEENGETSNLPADIHWEMLDKSKFFVLGAALFSGVSAALYPAVLLKTRIQISNHPTPSTFTVASSILRLEGPRGFYRGFATSLTGTIPARALYMAALESTKSAVGNATIQLGVPEPAASAAASAVAGISAAVAAQIVWTPIDVVSQRLMVQNRSTIYSGGIEAFRKILRSDGLRGLYRGFGMSILTYAPSNAVWWASYSISQRFIWGGIGISSDYGKVIAVQGISAAIAGGASAVVTMPLDTIKTRMQVMNGGDEGTVSIRQTVRRLMKEGGWRACYRGLGPRWASMSFSSTTMITTYELLKRLSAKEGTL